MKTSFNSIKNIYKGEYKNNARACVTRNPCPFTGGGCEPWCAYSEDGPGCALMDAAAGSDPREWYLSQMALCAATQGGGAA